jgi:3-methyladenine DNA glycosylase AlkD
MTVRTALAGYHDEVVQALKSIGDPALGIAIQEDRGSQLEHLAIRFPALRRRVKQGFSFYENPEPEVLEIWDGLWRISPYGDVLFAVLEYYAPVVRKEVAPSLWPVAREWITRVDNWCHSDMLSGIYSRILERFPNEVFPVLRSWNASESLWPRRISLTSLVHYTGKNAVFLTPGDVFPFVEACIDDDRHYVTLAVGWVLREMARAYPVEVTTFLERHAPGMSAPAFSRAIERHPAAEKDRLRALRKAVRR